MLQADLLAQLKVLVSVLRDTGISNLLEDPKNLSAEPFAFFNTVATNFAITHDGKNEISSDYAGAVVDMNKKLAELKTLLLVESEHVESSVFDIVADLLFQSHQLTNQIPNEAKGEHYVYAQNLALACQLMHEVVFHGRFPVWSLEIRVHKTYPHQIAEGVTDDLLKQYAKLTSEQIATQNSALEATFKDQTEPEATLVTNIQIWIGQQAKVGQNEGDCFCAVVDDRVPIKLPTCKHAVHQKCFMDWCTFNAALDSLSCPHCGKDYSQQIVKPPSADAAEGNEVEESKNDSLEKPQAKKVPVKNEQKD